jgi:hypothetical protein
MMIAIHAATTWYFTMTMKALMMSSLSAKGSRNVPNTLTSLRLRAKYPSKGSVAQAKTKIEAATNLAQVASGMVKTIKTGTRISLDMVILLARVMTGRLLETRDQNSGHGLRCLEKWEHPFQLLARVLL